MNDYGSSRVDLAKELTLKAMEAGLLTVSADDATPEEKAKTVADFFNMLLQSIKTWHSALRQITAG